MGFGNSGVETKPQSFFECPLWRFYHAKVDSQQWVDGLNRSRARGAPFGNSELKEDQRCDSLTGLIKCWLLID